MERRQAGPPPRCTACSADRSWFGGERVTAIYEMHSYRCPVCRTEVRVIEPSERPNNNGSRYQLKD